MCRSIHAPLGVTCGPAAHRRFGRSLEPLPTSAPSAAGEDPVPSVAGDLFKVRPAEEPCSAARLYPTVGYFPLPCVPPRRPDSHDLQGGSSTHFWQLHNLRSLVQSDMKIFGDSKHPAVSLHLRESGEPINVLTGMDYWLDNLMCNVPEVVMWCVFRAAGAARLSH